MDMPRPGTRRDPHRRPSDVARGILVGNPWLALSATRVTQPFNQVTIRNGGSSILPWRAIPSQPWIIVDKVAGVSLASTVPCSAGSPCERSPVLSISIDPARAPPNGEGHVRVENVLTGQSTIIQVIRGNPNYRYFTGVPGVARP
jgi:hypothetical protein